MGAAVAAAGAAVARARRKVISHFLSQNAVTPASAVPFEPGRRLERRWIEQLRDADVLRPGTNGGFYIDVPSYDAWTNKRRGRAKLALLGGLGAIAAGLAIGLLG